MQAPNQSAVNISAYPASDAVVIHTGIVGEGGAPWRLYSDGTIVVNEGFIHWDRLWTSDGWFVLAQSPWNEHRYSINRIIFTGPIIGGTSLTGLFAQLSNVTTIDGLHYFDTSHVTNMWGMFEGLAHVTTLDLSAWDTSNVMDMTFMFARTSHLVNLDVSGWDTRNVGTMTGMFSGANSLGQLALGEQFIFSRRVDIDLPDFMPDAALKSEVSPSHVDAGLIPPPQNDNYTGYWQNVGSGTVNNPQGEFVFTATELMENFDGSTMADTWVWQPRNPPPPTPDFDDVASDSWYHGYAQFAAQKNIMQGTGYRIFSPHATLNRAMLATILWRMAEEPIVAFQPVFSDVPSDAPAWYRNAVIWASEYGIVRGFDGRFDPYGAVTREQFAAMLYRYARFAGVNTNVPEAFHLNNFQDREALSDWAEAYMYWAVYHELIRGVDAQTLAPGDGTIRAQGAAILMRYMLGFVD